MRMPLARRPPRKTLDIVKTLALMTIAVLCIIALVTPVGASMLLRGGLAGSGVTDPGPLLLLGATLVTIGVWTRRVLFGQRSDATEPASRTGKS